jgi:hypothetical protein
MMLLAAEAVANVVAASLIGVVAKEKGRYASLFNF